MEAVSIIIPTINRAESLALTLASIAQQAMVDVDYDIVIVDNGSTDHTASVSAQAIASYHTHSIRYIYDPIPGLLTGRHRGALETEAELLVFVDDDIDAAPCWLQAIVETFADPSIQLVGGRNLPRYEAEPPAWIDGFRHSTSYGGWALGHLSLLDLGNQILEIDASYIWGLNFAIRRQALFDLGGFHPDNIPDHLQHFQGDGESGLTMKAKQRGYRAVYQPRALIYHRIPASRLTPAYFEKRAFYQGVCDSYTYIRRTQSVGPLPWTLSGESWSTRWDRRARLLPHYARHPLRYGRILAQRILALSAHRRMQITEDKEHRAVEQRVQTAYRAGYQFHHNRVQQDPRLLEWVLRESYWDYHLPELTNAPQFPT